MLFKLSKYLLWILFNDFKKWSVKKTKTGEKWFKFGEKKKSSINYDIKTNKKNLKG